MKWRFIQVVGLLLVASCHPAVAEESYYSVTQDQVAFEYLDDQDDGAVGKVVFNNIQSWGRVGVHEFVIDTEYGPFVFTVNTTRNDQCGPILCPDTLEVIDWPIQIAVRPSFIEVDELDTGELRVFEVLGF